MVCSGTAVLPRDIRGYMMEADVKKMSYYNFGGLNEDDREWTESKRKWSSGLCSDLLF